MVEEPQFAKTHGNVKGAKRRGLLYQQHVVERLEDWCKDEWVPIAGPWFEFVDFSGHRYAQADWLGFNYAKGLICLAEVKLTRVPDAWWQLNRLYAPLVKKLFPDFELARLEISTNLLNVMVPEDVKVIHKLDDVRDGCTSFMRIGYGR